MILIIVSARRNQDKELVSCEKIVPAERLAEEYDAVKSLVEEALDL